MHEWALADAVICTAVKVARTEKFSRVTDIHLVLGELQQIDATLFRSLVADIACGHDTLFDGTDICIDIQPATLTCRGCGHRWSFQAANEQLDADQAEAIHMVPELAHACMQCPRCRSSDFEISAGRGVWVESVSGVR